MGNHEYRQYLLSAFYMPGTGQSQLHILSLLNPQNKYRVIPKYLVSCFIVLHLSELHICIFYKLKARPSTCKEITTGFIVVV